MEDNIEIIKKCYEYCGIEITESIIQKILNNPKRLQKVHNIYKKLNLEVAR